MSHVEISFRHGTWRLNGKYNFPVYECDAEMLSLYTEEQTGWCYIIRESVFGKWVDVTPWTGVFTSFQEAANEAYQYHGPDNPNREAQ